MQEEKSFSKTLNRGYEVPLTRNNKGTHDSGNMEKRVLHNITVTREMYSLKTFRLEKNEFKGRFFPVVQTTIENLCNFNGAWIYMVNDSLVALYDHFEVHNNIQYELKELEKVTLIVYFAKRPCSFFPNNPRQVGVSIKLLNMSEIDTMKQTFQARFILKTVWEPSPTEIQTFQQKGYHSTGSGWRPRFIFPNCTVVEKRDRYRWPLKARDKKSEPYILSKYLLLRDGELDPYGSVLNTVSEYLMYGELGFHGTFAELLELEAFPLDCQDFSIICWSNDVLKFQQIVPFDVFFGEKVRKGSEYEGLGNLPLLTLCLSSSNVVSEWDIKNASLSLQKGVRSKMYIIIKARRRYYLYLWRIFIPVFLLAFGALVSFLLSPDDGHERVNLVFTAVLASVIYQLAVYGELPQIPYMTFLDWYNLTYFLLMLLFLFESSLIDFYNEEYFAQTFHAVDVNQLRRIDLQLGLVCLFITLGSLIFFAIWGYKLYKSQDKKLVLSYYEQCDAGIIIPPKVNYNVFSTERLHENIERKKTRKAYGWLKNYFAKIEL